MDAPPVSEMVTPEGVGPLTAPCIVQFVVQEITVNTSLEDVALATPSTVTTTSPVVAVAGTTATMDVDDQELIVAATPCTVTLPLASDCVGPKLVPAIVMADPTGPLLGVTLLTVGGEAMTVKVAELLAGPTPPSLELTCGIEFVYEPPAADVTLTLTVQVEVAATVPLESVMEELPAVAPTVPPHELDTLGVVATTTPLGRLFT